MSWSVRLPFIATVALLGGCSGETQFASCKATADADLMLRRATPHLIACARSGVAPAEATLGMIYIEEGATICIGSSCDDKVGVDSGLPVSLTKSNAVEEGMRLLRAAANKGEARALNEMGYAALEGILGVERNHVEARTFFERATAAGDMIGPYNLARIYFSGDGVPRSEVLGERYLRMSAERGYHNALCSLAEFEKRRNDRDQSTGAADDPECSANEVMDEVKILSDAT